MTRLRVTDALDDRDARDTLVRRWRRQQDGRATVLELLDASPTERTWVRAMNALLAPTSHRGGDEACLRALEPVLAHWPDAVRVVPPVLYGHIHERRQLPEHLDARVYARADAVLRACRVVHHPHARLHDGDLAAIAACPDLARLRELDVSHGRVTDAGLAALASSTTLSRLERLDVSRNAVGPQALEHLVDGPWTGLRSLQIGRTGLGESLGSGLCRARWPLRRLEAPDSQLTADELVRLAEASCMDTLEHLDVSDNPLDGDSLAAVLEATPRLHVLVAASIGLVGRPPEPIPRRRWRRHPPPVVPRPIGPRLHEVLSASTSGRLHQLDLSRNRLGTDLMHTLAGAPRLQTLEHLALSLDEAEGRTLVEAAPRWPLRSLQLAALDALAADTVGAVLSAFDTVDTLRLEVGRRAAPAWLEVMVSAPVAEHLTTLDLSGVAIGTHGASVLGDAVLPELTTLSLDGAELSAPALSALSSGAGLAALQRLRLSNNRFGPIGVAALARASWAGRVTHLDLRHCALGDAGARRLADSGLLEQVVELDLTLNRLGDDGALAVVDALVRRGRTGRVDLRNNPILEAGRQAVHQRAAGCEGLEVIV